jgi:release factor glutamine methyltransferase
VEVLCALDLWQWRAEQLRLGGRPVDLDWLLDLAGGLPWSELQQLRLEPRRVLRLARPRSDLAALWQRHCTGGEPLQYLAGLAPWRDLVLAVAPGVLIPRPETELLIDWALEHAAARPSASGGLWADLGTGSGCLALALALALPSWQGLAVDASPEALRQAEGNLLAHGQQGHVQLLEGSWWQPLAPWWGQLDLVLANPPYIPSAMVAGLDPTVRCHEPWLALDGGGDGMEALRSIIAGAPTALAPGGWLLLEHHHDQSAAVKHLLTAAGLMQVTLRHDLEGRGRFAIACRPPSSP